jgi:hypothetical protein
MSQIAPITYDGLTLPQERFAQAYVQDGTGIAVSAWRKAHQDSEASQDSAIEQASRTLALDKVRARIAQLEAERLAAAGLTADHTLERLRAYMDDSEPKVRTASVKAVELALRHLGMITERRVEKVEGAIVFSLSLGELGPPTPPLLLPSDRDGDGDGAGAGAGAEEL